MRPIFAALIVLVVSSLAGCATYGRIDDKFGKSYQAVKSGQILNPGASRNLTPVTGLSGKAAEVITNKYLELLGETPEKEDNNKGCSVPKDKDVAGVGKDDYRK